MLDRLIFLSNSIPKSGSPLLFNLQRDFLLALAGRNSCDYSVLEDRGIPLKGGYLATKDIRSFVNALSDGLTPRGPLVLKVHTPVDPYMRAAYEAHDNFFMSLCVRDPLDCLLSGMENHRRTGEFQMFKTLEQGCELVTNFFQSIYDTSVAIETKPVPVVRYTDLKADPVGAVLSSLHPDLFDMVARSIVEQHLDVEASSKKAAKRLQRGGLSRDISEVPKDKQAYVLDTLHDFRAKLGYARQNGRNRVRLRKYLGSGFITRT